MASHTPLGGPNNSGSTPDAALWPSRVGIAGLIVTQVDVGSIPTGHPAGANMNVQKSYHLKES